MMRASPITGAESQPPPARPVLFISIPTPARCNSFVKMQFTERNEINGVYQRGRNLDAARFLGRGLGTVSPFFLLGSGFSIGFGFSNPAIGVDSQQFVHELCRAAKSGLLKRGER